MPPAPPPDHATSQAPAPAAGAGSPAELPTELPAAASAEPLTGTSPASRGDQAAGVVAEALDDRFQWRGRWAWAYAGVWLLFLAGALERSLAQPDRRRGAVAVAVLVAFAVLYLRTWLTARTLRRAGQMLTTRRRIALASLATALTLLEVALIGEPAMAMATFLIVIVMLLVPRRWALAPTAAIIVAAVGATEWMPGWQRDLSLPLGLIMTGVIMLGVMNMVERNAQLARAQRRLAELAVVDERARFARDLHDLLGHSLTLLTIKAELAGRLVRLDPERAEAEIGDVERLARDALVDVRAAVGGYRQANLSGELVSARAVLDAAGIEAELPSAVDDVPGERRELLGWAVREGVTNVVRHSGARRCRIVVSADGVEIHDDGRGLVPASAPVGGWAIGSGLAGLRERAEAVGATVVVGPSPDGGLELRVGW